MIPESSWAGARVRLRDMSPASHALVMATGIVSLAASLAGLRWIPGILFWLNKAAFVVLWALVIARLWIFPRHVRGDALNGARNPGFYTLVAATAVLGAQYVLLARDGRIASVLWVIAAALWVLFVYGFFALFFTQGAKPAEGVSGAWLMVAVATQSVAILTTLLAGAWGPWRSTGWFAGIALFFVGCTLYAVVIVLIIGRVILTPPTARDLGPSYWINMGAAAISTLAGATLLRRADLTVLAPLGGAVMAMTLLLWAWATWWLPLLIALGAWRHTAGGVRLTYDTEYWSLVFPLGMYTTATFELAAVVRLPLLSSLAAAMLYAALIAWVWTFGGLVTAAAAAVREDLGRRRGRCCGT